MKKKILPKYDENCVMMHWSNSSSSFDTQTPKKQKGFFSKLFRKKETKITVDE